MTNVGYPKNWTSFKGGGQFRVVAKVSNPILISDFNSRYLLYEASLVVNLGINSSFIVDYSKHKELTSLMVGMKFNIGI